MKGVIAWFARNHVAANLLMAAMAVGGIVMMPRIQQKTFPDIDVNVISVAVVYLGAAPEEVEQGVCIRIEEEIHGIEGIEKLSSSAAEGACGVRAVRRGPSTRSRPSPSRPRSRSSDTSRSSARSCRSPSARMPPSVRSRSTVSECAIRLQPSRV
jgi:hypothetical protein